MTQYHALKIWINRTETTQLLNKKGMVQLNFFIEKHKVRLYTFFFNRRREDAPT